MGMGKEMGRKCYHLIDVERSNWLVRLDESGNWDVYDGAAGGEFQHSSTCSIDPLPSNSFNHITNAPARKCARLGVRSYITPPRRDLGSRLQLSAL